jgi:SAM-dependent methyltransferase
MDHNYLKLNLGCGKKSLSGYTNVDKILLPNVNLVFDLEKTPLPFKTNSVREVRCDHVLEHIYNFIPLMEELHRVCIPGGLIYISAPYYKYEGAYRDPTHVRFFTENTFYYFQESASLSHYTKVRFNVKNISRGNCFHTDLRTSHKNIIKFIPFKKFLNLFLWNMYSEINYELEVVK